MDWMEAGPERRGSPAGLWPEVRSIVMLGLSYAPEHDPMEMLAERGTAALATYAYFAYTGAYVPAPGWHVFAVLPVLLMIMALVMALSCVTSVLNNIANDTALTVNYAVSFLLLATPVAYPLDALPKDWQWAFLLNPLTPAFEVWRWALLGTPLPPWWSIAAGVFLTAILLAGGLIFFLRWEQTILDRS